MFSINIQAYFVTRTHVCLEYVSIISIGQSIVKENIFHEHAQSDIIIEQQVCTQACSEVKCSEQLGHLVDKLRIIDSHAHACNQYIHYINYASYTPQQTVLMRSLGTFTVSILRFTRLVALTVPHKGTFESQPNRSLRPLPAT